MTIVYTKAQVDEMAVEIGGEIKTVRITVPTVTQQTGQSTTQAVSQKLFTDTVGNVEAALTAINGA